MAIYEIYAPERPSSGLDAASATVLVRDGLRFWALVLPFLWLAWHRLWLALAAYLFFTAALAVAMRFGSEAFGVLSFLPGLYLFFEGGRLLAWKAERRGRAFAGVVEAPDEAEAERRWFLRNPPQMRSERPLPALSPQAGSADDEPEFGVFSAS